ncbi:MAG: hypothetical protein R3C59_12765 [Planctomycetaceae bacterium]
MITATPPASVSDSEGDYELDPMFVTSLAEAKWILGMWLTCFVWTLAICLTNGYPETVNPETFPLILGMPAWVAWGIAFPWLIANLATFVFCLGFMKDGDLGSEPDTHAPATAGAGANNV